MLSSSSLCTRAQGFETNLKCCLCAVDQKAVTARLIVFPEKHDLY